MKLRKVTEETTRQKKAAPAATETARKKADTSNGVPGGMKSYGTWGKKR